MEFDKAYFDAGIDRVGTECEKWDGMIEETGDADMLPMWVADMDFPSAPAIAKALEGVLSLVFLYPFAVLRLSTLVVKKRHQMMLEKREGS